MSKDELIREITRIIKAELLSGGSNTHLPADSFIERAAEKSVDLIERNPIEKNFTVEEYSPICVECNQGLHKECTERLLGREPYNRVEDIIYGCTCKCEKGY